MASEVKLRHECKQDAKVHVMRTKFLNDVLGKMRGNERKQDGGSFPESYAALRVMFDQSSLLMGLLRPDGIVVDMNSTACSFLRGRKSEVIGKFFWDTPWWTHSPEQQEQLRGAIKSAAQGEFVRFETTHPTPAGNLIYIDFSLKPVKDDNGNVVLLLPEGRDITERKQAEEALRESYALLRVTFDQSSSLMGLLKPDGIVLDINSTAHSFISIEKSEVIGRLFWETPWWAHSPKQQDQLREAIKSAARGEFVRFEAIPSNSRWKVDLCRFLAETGERR